MDTISRIKIKAVFHSIQWRIVLVFLLVVVLSFLALAALMMRVVTNYMYQQKAQEELSGLAALSAKIAPQVSARDADEAYRLALEYARSHNGRVLVLDEYGKVIIDSFAQMEGVRLDQGEALEVLGQTNQHQYGFHRIRTSQEDETSWWEGLMGQGQESLYVGYFASSMNLYGQPQGAVFFSTSVQPLVDELSAVQARLVAIMLLVALVAVLLALLFSRLITRPIAALQKNVVQLSRGDFSTRADMRGSNEISQLAKTLNVMSEKLQHLDESRNQFISSASHELKTPLSTIKIMVESLLHQPDMDEAIRQEFLSDVNSEIDRMNFMIVDLLTLVQMDSKEIRMRMAVVSLGELAMETVRRLSPLAEKSGVRVDLVQKDEVMIEADRARMQQVIYNLVDNAIKYTPEKGYVRVAVFQRDQTAVITVTDTGIGIPARDLPHVFDRFYRVDKARSRATGGTGLGLSIVKQIVLMHEGEIEVASEENKGSTFTIEMPAV